jgi:uncharacterized protein (TIGR03067 family)
MFLTKLKAATAVLLVLALGAVSYGLLTPGQAGTAEGHPAGGEKPPAQAKDDRQKELEALQGTWAAVTVERNGQRAPAEALKGFEVVIQGNRMTINPGKDDRTSTFTLDPSKRPRWLDNTPEQGPKKGQSLPAIYELQGDSLKLCFDNEGVSDKRPTAFRTTSGSGLALFVLQREKQPTPAELIKAATTRPWPGENYPALPTLSTATRGQVANEIAASPKVRAAYAKLDARGRNTTWFEGVKELEQEKAVWCVASCLVHPSEDVQIHALRALERLNDKRAVPLLVLYAEYMAVHEGGSENATIHGVIHQATAKTLSALTGVRVTLRRGQDPEGLLRGVRQWRKWLCDQPP